MINQSEQDVVYDSDYPIIYSPFHDDDYSPFEFRSWPKIARWYDETVVISEKIDGTNSCVGISEQGDVWAQSRKRIITPEDDNFGFAKWVETNEDELRNVLGVGHHFGEWWGQGIQRGYDLQEKRFSLFNTKRWEENCPTCCHVVPILWQGKLIDLNIEHILIDLLKGGSKAAPGFKYPEGICMYLRRANLIYKIPFDKS